MTERNDLEYRVRQLEKKAAAHGYRLAGLESFRKDYRPKVDSLMSQDAIETALRERLAKVEARGWSTWERRAGFVIASATVLSVIMQGIVIVYHASGN